MNNLLLLCRYLCPGDTLLITIQKKAFPGAIGEVNIMRRTLLLDEDDLIMVVKQDVVKQIDENRGEMNRTEFVNYLIQCQLKEYAEPKQYITREEFQSFAQQITGLLHDFLEFFVSYGMAMGRGQCADIESLNQQLQAFSPADDEGGDPQP
jgi:hypothetical protein